MGEAIIVGRGTRESSIFQDRLITEIITENCVWPMPECINQSVDVRIFGGGGAECYNYRYSTNGGNGICIIQYYI